MPSAENSDLEKQDNQIREIEEEIEKDTAKAATKKQEGSPESPGSEYQILHARNREEEREADSSEPKKDSKPEYPMVQIRKSEDTAEADVPELELKEKKGIIDPLPAKKPKLKSVTNIQKEDSDGSSMKEFMKGCIRESAAPEQNSDSASRNEDEDAKETVAIRLRVTEIGPTEVAKTKEVTVKQAPAAISGN